MFEAQFFKKTKCPVCGKKDRICFTPKDIDFAIYHTGDTVLPKSVIVEGTHDCGKPSMKTINIYYDDDGNETERKEMPHFSHRYLIGKAIFKNGKLVDIIDIKKRFYDEEE